MTTPMLSIDPPTPTPAIPATDSPTHAPKFTSAIIDRDQTRAQLMAHFCVTRCHLEMAFLEHNERDGLKAACVKPPDLVFIYLNFATMSPAEFIQKISASAPHAKLILFIEGCREYLVHLISASFYSGLLCVGEATLDELGRIIEDIVRRGVRFVSPTIVNCLNGLRSNANAFPKLLTKTQMNVLICIAHSLSDEEIAARFHCSAGTVLSHRRQIMNKLNIHTTPKLIRYGIEKGFDAVPLPAVVSFGKGAPSETSGRSATNSGLPNRDESDR